MNRLLLALGIAVPAASTARGTSPVREGGPPRASRRSRIRRLAVALATCGAVALAGWILVTGVFDREPTTASVAASGCDASSCMAHFAPASRELPREWRWSRQKVEFEHMYRR